VDDLLSIALSNAVAAAVLALVAAITGAVCRRPALVHGLWLLVLLKLVTPPLVRIPVAWPSAPESRQIEVATFAADEPPSETTPPPLEQPAVVLVLPASAEDEPAASTDTAIVPPAPASADPPLWPRLLPMVWLAGSLAWFVLAVVRLGRFRRLLRFARRAPAALQERAARLSRRLGLPRCPRVDLLPGRIAPMLWAISSSPRLLVPADLLDVLGDEQLNTLLVHELAHLRRRDHWVRALEFVVMGLYWWHPVVWYARRELREAEEQCCDAWVVSTLPGAGRAYATALMDTLDFLSTARPAVPPLASGIGHVHDLKRRLAMIMRGTTPRALSWPGCLIMLALGAFFLPMLPALHGQAPSKDDVKKQLLDEQNAKGKLDAAKADLQKLEATLKAKMAEVEAAKAALQAAAEDLRAHQTKVDALKRAQGSALPQNYRKRLIGVREEKPKGDDLKEKQVRVEILVNAEGLNVEELSKKLAKLLPDGKARITIQGVGGKVLIDHGTGRIEYYRAKPVEPAPPAAPPPQPRKPGERSTIPLPSGAPQDKRINELEKKLEKVLQELQELRKQMKEPRSGSSAATPHNGFSVPAPKPPKAPRIQPPVRIQPPDGDRKDPSFRDPSLDNPYYAPTVPLVPAKPATR
jgi:beta-lactamase regulating signal transducer with metallopeptidase domain